MKKESNSDPKSARPDPPPPPPPRLQSGSGRPLGPDAKSITLNRDDDAPIHFHKGNPDAGILMYYDGKPLFETTPSGIKIITKNLSLWRLIYWWVRDWVALDQIKLRRKHGT